MADNFATTGAWVIAIKRALEFLGQDIEPLLEQLDICEKDYTDPEYRISSDKLNKLYWLCADKVDDTCFAITVAEHIHPSVFSALGYGMLASETPRAVLQRLVDYQRLISNTCNLTLKEDAQNVALSIVSSRYQDDTVVLGHELVVSFTATIIQFLRTISGKKITPVNASFISEEPGRSEEASAFFGCQLNFNSPENLIVFDRAILEQALPTSNPKVAQMHDLLAVETLKKLDKEDLVTTVKVRIVNSLTQGIPSQEEVAKDLNMSLRNLQRKLGSQGTCFKDILDNLRRTLALQYIKQSRLSLGEISHLLGFSSATNFSRAFKRWTSQAPGEYREHQANQASK